MIINSIKPFCVVLGRDASIQRILPTDPAKMSLFARLPRCIIDDILCLLDPTDKFGRVSLHYANSIGEIHVKTFSYYKGITLLLPNSKVRHNVEYEDNEEFIDYNEVYLDTPLQINNNNGTKGLPMHTECWDFAKTKFKHELKFEDFIYNKNVKAENFRVPYLFDSLDYGVAKKYQGQDWSDNNYGLDPNSFLLNNKDWHILYHPSNKSDEAIKNSKRIEKILKKIINGIKKPKQEITTKKLNKDRPSPPQSATLFKKGTKKKGNDGNMYIVETDKNGTKKWKKYIKENKNRSSPAKSATAFKEGTKKKGNDGNMYIIVVNKNGVKRWSKIN